MNKFEVKPDSINRGIRSDQGYLISSVVPELERQAIQIMVNSGIVDQAYYNPPGPTDGEAWRLFWVNEALQQCDADDFDEDYLGQAGRAAVNVLVTASVLRDSLEYGAPGQAAALAMVLLSDAVIGGISIDLASAAEKLSESVSAKRVPYDRGIGKGQIKFNQFKAACIKFASEKWSADSGVMIGEMAEFGIAHIRDQFGNNHRPGDMPSADTVKGWLRAAGKSGHIKIPASATKGGRPKKAQ